jgi:ParB-like nuclease family protein
MAPEITLAIELFIPKSCYRQPALPIDLCHTGVEAVSKPESFPIDKIYVPVKRKKTIKPELVREIAESILEFGQQTPILVRPDEGRFVLVEGLHRFEACKALGETTIIGVLVSDEFEHKNALSSDSPEVKAERDKMVRLKKLRLEKEAAERSAASTLVLDTESAELRRNRSETGIRNKASRSQISESTPRTLSEWITQQKRDGGRY